ncbi:MAG TPA: hypothetical protein VKU80_17630 [Planctomycetota bacterium]|nr:hypothetical protein [Planctomycetota bacterium]
MKRFCAIVTPKPDLDFEGEEEEDVVMDLMYLSFGIGRKSAEKDPWEVVTEILSALHLSRYVDVDLYEMTTEGKPRTFDEWFATQPFAPNADHGLLIPNTAVRFMRRAWNSSRYTADLKRVQATEPSGERLRGDVRD